MFLKCTLSAHRCQHKLCVDANFWCCANVSLFFIPPRFLLKAVNAEDRQSIVWKLGYEPWLPRAATYCPTPPHPHSHPSPPTVMNLLHQQGLSALQIQARRLAAWEQISLLTCSSSSILTQDFIALSRGRITPDKSAYGHERMCTCEQEPVKSDGINARAQNVCWFFYCQFK